MKNFLPVVLAIIEQNGKYLLTLRSGEAKDVRYKDHWQIPGGELEFGEDASSCAIREAREETGLEIQVVRMLPYIYHRIAGARHLLFLVYLCKPKGFVKTITLNHEAKDYQWFTALEIQKLPKTLPNVKDVFSRLFSIG